MTKEEIREEIKKVERAIFIEEMADFMNWSRYYQLTAKRDNLKKELAE